MSGPFIKTEAKAILEQISLNEFSGPGVTVALARLRIAQRLLIGAGSADLELCTDANWQRALCSVTTTIEAIQKAQAEEESKKG